MTTQDKLIRKKLSLLELAEFLQNISEACRINGCSRQHFYDVKQAYEQYGLRAKGKELEETLFEESGCSGGRRSRGRDGSGVASLGMTYSLV